MYLDPRTIVIINIFSSAVLGLALLAVSQGYLKQIRGISQWAFTSLLHSFAWILFALRGVVPDFFSILLANGAILFSMAFYYRIISVFVGKEKYLNWVFYFVAGVLVVLAYSVWVKPDINFGILLMSSSSSLLLFASGYQLLFHRNERPMSHLFSGLVFVFSATILLLRTFYYLGWNTSPVTSFFTPSVMQSITFLTTYLTAAMLTFGFILMSYDRYITQHEQAEEKIIESENSLSEAQKLAKVGSWEFDLDTNELKWSKEQYHIFELEETPADQLYELCRTRIHPDDLAPMDEAIRVSKELGKGVVYEHRVIAKDGSIKHLLGTGETFKGADGKKNMLRGTVQDITSRKKTEQLSKEYEHFFNNSNDLVCIANFQGYLEIINPKFVEILGYSKEELLGNNFFKFIHPEDRASTAREGEKLQTGERSLNFVNRYKKKDGGYILLEWTSTADRFNGKIYANARDITYRSKAEESIRKFAILESKSKEMEQFAYIASHDLREPLLSIKNYVDLLADEYKGKLDADSDEYLYRISRATARMDELIKGLLDYSRLSKVKELQTVDCNEIMNQVIADIRVSIENSNAEIYIENLPVIQAYPLELKQLFQNLLTNAVKFKRKDEIPQIRVSTELQNDVWQFKFADNGIGLEEADREKIFDLFQRVHNRNEYQGSGIGLAYCKKIVELHHGNIWVDSILGKGSSFYFTISTT